MPASPLHLRPRAELKLLRRLFRTSALRLPSLHNLRKRKYVDVPDVVARMHVAEVYRCLAILPQCEELLPVKVLE